MDRPLRKPDPEEPPTPDFLNLFSRMGFGVGAVFLSESRCIQRKYDGGFVLVAQDAKGSGLNDKMASVFRRQPQPPGDQHPQNMAVGKK